MAWTYTNRLRRRIITFDSSLISGNVSNVVVPIILEIGDVPTSQLQSDGSDIDFTNSAGTSLDYYISYIDTTVSSGYFATIWVEIDTVSASADTTIYMYYYWDGTGSIADDSTLTIFSGYNMTWLIDADASGGTYTSTTGSVTFTNNGTSFSESGFLGGRINFVDTQGDYLSSSNFAGKFNAPEGTFFIYHLPQEEDSQFLIDDTGGHFFINLESDSDVDVGIDTGGDLLVSNGYNADIFQTIAITWNSTSGEVKIYINGVLEDTDTGFTGLALTGTDVFEIGKAFASISYYDGLLYYMALADFEHTADELAIMCKAPMFIYDEGSYEVGDGEIITLPTESISKKAVELNLIDAVDTDRNVAILENTTDGSNGTDQDLPSENRVLLKEIEKILDVDSYGHEIILDLDNTKIQYNVIVPTDRSDYIIFSAHMNNIENAVQVQGNAQLKNFVYVDGTSYDVEVGTATGLDRREIYYRDSGIKTESQTENEGQKILDSRYKETDKVDCKIKQDIQYEYGVDYYIGDYISVEFDGTLYTRQITAVDFSFTQEGKRIMLTFGDDLRNFLDTINDIREA